jgi:hypothetical protein
VLHHPAQGLPVSRGKCRAPVGARGWRASNGEKCDGGAEKGFCKRQREAGELLNVSELSSSVEEASLCEEETKNVSDWREKPRAFLEVMAHLV